MNAFSESIRAGAKRAFPPLCAGKRAIFLLVAAGGLAFSGCAYENGYVASSSPGYYDDEGYVASTSPTYYDDEGYYGGPSYSSVVVGTGGYWRGGRGYWGGGRTTIGFGGHAYRSGYYRGGGIHGTWHGRVGGGRYRR